MALHETYRDGVLVASVDIPEPDDVVAARTLEERLRRFLDVNRDYLAVDSPTAAQARTQTDRLTRQVNAVIRLILRDLDTTDGTDG